ncbi:MULTISPECIES: radical SAM protein [unclassified Kitasatospora]|uniref:radical SAM protein n=1 Tax=unclassified Kitasatospora TaxID=2633591 RepID=UPI002473E4A4|nr:radical SAM protein [Kitasatospora sp. MAP12-44]
MTAIMEPPMSAALAVPHVIELEITGKCQLQCTHCFADSGPTGTHGTMTHAEWCDVIDQAAELGIAQVQLIGGEPTTFPGWRGLVDHALSRGRKVEVFSNLFHMPGSAWTAVSQPGVTLATSYYSVNAGEHDKVTKVVGSHQRTRQNIVEAVKRGIPIRAGVVGCNDGQLERLAVEELRLLGVQHVALDYVRGVGRATTREPNISALCGNCGRGRLAVMPDGAVSPCVLGRWLQPASILQRRLADILASPEWTATVAGIPGKAQNHGATVVTMDCPPSDSNDCNPATTEACDPAYDFTFQAGGAPNDNSDCNPNQAPSCLPNF